MRLSRFAIPLVLFVTIVVFSFFGLEIQDRDKLPSALIDKPFPEFVATSLFDATLEIIGIKLFMGPVGLSPIRPLS